MLVFFVSYQWFIASCWNGSFMGKVTQCKINYDMKKLQKINVEKGY
jgi:hypothetical protein